MDGLMGFEVHVNRVEGSDKWMVRLIVVQVKTSNDYKYILYSCY